MKYFKNNEKSDHYYKVFPNGSWQWFILPKDTGKTTSFVLEWENGGINFESRSTDNAWDIEEINETQLKAAIFVLAL